MKTLFGRTCASNGKSCSLDLPSSYLYQMVAMVFTDNQEIPPIPIEESASLTTSDQHRLFRAHCSYLKFMEFIDEVPESEQQRKRLEEEQKEKVSV